MTDQNSEDCGSETPNPEKVSKEQSVKNFNQTLKENLSKLKTNKAQVFQNICKTEKNLIVLGRNYFERKGARKTTKFQRKDSARLKQYLCRSRKVLSEQSTLLNIYKKLESEEF